MEKDLSFEIVEDDSNRIQLKAKGVDKVEAIYPEQILALVLE